MFMIIFIVLFILAALWAAIFVLPPQFLRNRIEERLGLAKGREEKYKELLQKDPDNIDALTYLGALRVKEQKYDEVYEHYSHLIVALRSRPEVRSKLNSFEIYLNFGIAAYHCNKKSEALTSLQKARLNLNSSETSDLFYYLGMLYYEKKEYREACTPLRQSLNQRKNDREVSMRLGISYFKTGNYEAAHAILQNFVDATDESSYYFGLCLARMDYKDGAIEQLEKTSEIPAFLIPSQYEIAKLCIKDETPEKANIALKACIKIIETCKTATEMDLSGEKLEASPQQSEQKADQGTGKTAGKEASKVAKSKSQSPDPSATNAFEAAPKAVSTQEPSQKTLRDQYYKELCFAHLHGSRLLGARGELEKACALIEPLVAMEPEYTAAVVLHKRYQQSLNNPQLFKLLECSQAVRKTVAKKLMTLLVPGLEEIQVINMKNLNIELTAIKKDETPSKYYLWINLQDSQVNIRQVFHAHANSKQQDCKHCIMAALSPFERDVETYTEGRDILLVKGAELRKLIKETAS